MKGYVQVYTGEGKGKTTAALGLAIRAAGAGHKVYIGQFVKKGEYSEVNALRRFGELIIIEQYGLERFIGVKPVKEDIEAARKGFIKVQKIIKKGEYKVVILDEANIALYYNLFSVDELTELIDSRAKETELIITGRHAPSEIINKADLVTEMTAIKHYYDKGVEARLGIEK